MGKLNNLSDRNKGIVFIILSAFGFAMMSAFIKLSGDLPSIQKTFFRNLVSCIIAFTLILKYKESAFGSKENRKEEIELLNTHSEKGYRIVMLDNKIAHISVGILTHHERWDGNGYPLGLKEEEIPIESRIVHLINHYENLRKEYINKGLESDILGKLKNESGKMFDPYIVKEFIKLLNKGLKM